MSTDNEFAPQDISNDEIRRRLTTEFNIECGPVTPSTRRVLLKKLVRLEQEKIDSANVNIYDDGEVDDLNHQSLVHENGNSSFINGNDDEANGEVEVMDVEDDEVQFKEPYQAQRKSPRRYSPRRKTDLEMKDAIKSFNVSFFNLLSLD